MPQSCLTAERLRQKGPLEDTGPLDGKFEDEKKTKMHQQIRGFNKQNNRSICRTIPTVKTRENVNESHKHTRKENATICIIAHKLDWVSFLLERRLQDAFPQIKCDFHLYAMLRWGPPTHYSWGGEPNLDKNQSISSWDLGNWIFKPSQDFSVINNYWILHPTFQRRAVREHGTGTMNETIFFQINKWV